VAQHRSTREQLVLEAIEMSLVAADVPTAAELAADLDQFPPHRETRLGRWLVGPGDRSR